MEHVEEAGIHSGDSSSVLPPFMLKEDKLQEIMETTKKLAKALHVVGLINVQYAMKDNTVYVLEVNPRASRTVPFVSKATGLPLAKIAAKVMVGKKLNELGLLQFDFRRVKYMSTKESVFPFNKFPKVKMFLGPEMRSTGEVMGISHSFGASVAKAQIAAGNPLPKEGTIFISVNQNDKKPETVNIAKDFVSLGFQVVATAGTADFLQSHGINAKSVYKVNEGRPNIVDAIKNGEIQMVINTPLGEESRYDEYAIGWASIQQKIAFITTLSAASTAVKGIERIKKGQLHVKSIQDFHAEIN